MPLKHTYCSKCGGDIVLGDEEGKPREVCSECGTIFYENPLPVASCVVLDDQRRVLLVKRSREPMRGEWCLPIGFAEVGETIAEAALRELEEEAGIRGEVVRLLDTDSYESDFYGDLLIVTFEVRKTGGREQPGTDSADVAYFPLDSHPPLAFRSNQVALAECVRLHAEEWGIQESFRRLQADDETGMLSDALIGFTRDHAADIAATWMSEVKENPSTLCYRRLDPEHLTDRVSIAMTEFNRWLKGHQADGEMAQFFRELGAERRVQGCELHEVLSSLSLLKKHIWSHVLSELGEAVRPVDVYTVLELDRRINSFFDRAMYQTAKGYAEV